MRSSEAHEAHEAHAALGCMGLVGNECVEGRSMSGSGLRLLRAIWVRWRYVYSVGGGCWQALTRWRCSYTRMLFGDMQYESCNFHVWKPAVTRHCHSFVSLWDKTVWSLNQPYGANLYVNCWRVLLYEVTTRRERVMQCLAFSDGICAAHTWASSLVICNYH